MTIILDPAVCARCHKLVRVDKVGLQITLLNRHTGSRLRVPRVHECWPDRNRPAAKVNA